MWRNVLNQRSAFSMLYIFAHKSHTRALASSFIMTIQEESLH
jgi:hypothetical protein